MQKPLDGMLVVSLEQAVAAPLASCRLADAGARVIKIERPGGDFARGYDSAVYGEASYFVWINRGKESLVLNLKEPGDKAVLLKILEKADVWIQNLAPGAADRLGVGSAKLRARNKRLITCDISGYGDGDYQDMKAYDLLVQCESGIVSVSGAPGEYGRIGVSICDIGTGINAYAGILEALFMRERTGKGSGVQASLFGTAANWMTVPLMQAEYGKNSPKRVGLNHPTISPYGGYRSKNGEMVVISIQNNREWAKLCSEVINRQDMINDPRYATNNARVANRSEVDEAISAAFGHHEKDQLIEILRTAGIAFGSVNSVDELATHPAMRRWPMLVNDQIAQMVAPAVTTEFDTNEFRPIPALGEHSAAIRAEFSD
ncbi:MAG: CaiB/BaiF CoA transferase family protein [Anaerolineae bacterium]